MSIDTVNKGELRRVQGAFIDTADQPVDPTTVTLKVMDPSGNIDTYTYSATLIRASQGVYYRDVDADEEGDWHYWWVSTGTGQGAEPGQFLVVPTPF